MTARRVQVTEETGVLSGFGYASAFEVRLQGAEVHSAERWARTCFEDAPFPLRLFVLAGWRFVLRLRLGARPSVDHVSGWAIVQLDPDAIHLEARSAHLTAHKIVRVHDGRVVVTTFVRHETRLGGALWAVVSPVHHQTEPLLLARAASALPGAS